ARLVGRFAVLFAGLAVLLAGCNSGSRPKQTVIARDSAQGKHARAEATASVALANGLSVGVRAQPRQRVTGTWTILCRAGSRGSARDADDFGGQAPLAIPMRAVDFTLAKGCTVIADARLTRSGRVHVAVLKQ